MDVPGTALELDLSEASRSDLYLGGLLIVIGLCGIVYNLLFGSLALVFLFVFNMLVGAGYIAWAADAFPDPGEV